MAPLEALSDLNSNALEHSQVGQSSRRKGWWAPGVGGLRRLHCCIVKLQTRVKKLHPCLLCTCAESAALHPHQTPACTPVPPHSQLWVVCSKVIGLGGMQRLALPLPVPPMLQGMPQLALRLAGVGFLWSSQLCKHPQLLPKERLQWAAGCLPRLAGCSHEALLEALLVRLPAGRRAQSCGVACVQRRGSRAELRCVLLCHRWPAGPAVFALPPPPRSQGPYLAGRLRIHPLLPPLLPATGR